MSSPVTLWNAVERFRAEEGSSVDVEYVPRFLKHTHPRCRAFLSSTDLYQLYSLQKNDKNYFAIVISPRKYGQKILCVHLTQDGLREIERHCNDAIKLAPSTDDGKWQRHCIQSHIDTTRVKLYCQIPFKGCEDSTHVVDLRTAEEVQVQLHDYIGQADMSEEDWFSHTN